MIDFIHTGVYIYIYIYRVATKLKNPHDRCRQLGPRHVSRVTLAKERGQDKNISHKQYLQYGEPSMRVIYNKFRFLCISLLNHIQEFGSITIFCPIYIYVNLHIKFTYM